MHRNWEFFFVPLFERSVSGTPHLFQILLRSLQKCLPRQYPVPAIIDVGAKPLVLEPVANLLLGPLCEWHVQLTVGDVTQKRLINPVLPISCSHK